MYRLQCQKWAHEAKKSVATTKETAFPKLSETLVLLHKLSLVKSLIHNFQLRLCSSESHLLFIFPRSQILHHSAREFCLPEYPYVWCTSSNSKARLGWNPSPRTRALPQRVDHRHEWDNATFPFDSSLRPARTLLDAGRRSTR